VKIFELLSRRDAAYKKNLLFFLIAYFFVLLNYPLIRASSTTLFFEAYGAKSSPSAWLWAVLFLSITIFICNKLQSIFSVQKVFFVVSLASVFFFILSSLGFYQNLKSFAYIPFVWKEIYIVLQVHLMLAYANNFFTKEEFKFILGPVGAVGSVGGILGGLLTSYLSREAGTMAVMIVGIVFVMMPGILFLFTSAKIQEKVEKKSSPLSSLNNPEIRKYVFYIAAMVALTQFIINIADFKFNMAFEMDVLDSSKRTSYLGDVYTITNLLTFCFQFILLPFVLPKVSEKNYHLFIPVSYLVCFMVFAGQGLLSVAAFYVYLKASDYSLFSAGKEILYQPLGENQKYGAKYLTDMLVYRFSKAMIAVVLIYLQTSRMLNILMGLFLFLWVGLVLKLFKLHKKLFERGNYEKSFT